MNYLIKRFSIVAISAFAVPAMLVAPVYARQGGQGSDDATNGSGSTGSGSSTTVQAPTAVSATDLKKINETEVRHQIDSFQQRGQEAVKLLESKLPEAQKHTEQERQKSCETRSAELTKKLNKKVADAVKYKSVFDKIFSRVQDFHDTKGLTTPDYATLVSKAKDAQVAADSSIATLKSFDTTIDCTQVDAAATKVAAFREALKATRDSLKAYKTSIKNLIVAVKASVPAETQTTPTTGTVTPGASN